MLHEAQWGFTKLLMKMKKPLWECYLPQHERLKELANLLILKN